MIIVFILFKLSTNALATTENFRFGCSSGGEIKSPSIQINSIQDRDVKPLKTIRYPTIQKREQALSACKALTSGYTVAPNRETNDQYSLYHRESSIQGEKLIATNKNRSPEKILEVGAHLIEKNLSARIPAKKITEKN